MDGWTFVLTLITGVLTGGGIGGIILALNARRKAKSEIAANEAEASNKNAEAEKKEAETSEIITRAAGAVAQMLEVQLCALRNEVDQLRAENAALRQVQAKHEREISELQAMCEQFDEVLTGAHELYSQVVELNHTPKYKPPERRTKK